MNRFIVTGASGFVGSALMRQLRAAGHSAMGVGRQPAPTVDQVVRAYDDASHLCGLLRKDDVIVHLAARAHQRGPADDAAFADNVLSTAALLKAARNSGAARFVFVSSIGVNGQKTSLAPFSERDAPSPSEPYARSKLACEQLVAEASASGGPDHVIVRPPLVYGPNAPGNFSRLARSVVRGWPLPLGAVRNRRSFVAIDNLVDFLTLCAEHPAACNRTFLVADGEDLSTPQWIKRMAEAAGHRSARLVPVPQTWLQVAGALLGRQEAVNRVCDSLQVDITLARDRLGWTPVVSVNEGLRRAMSQARA